MHTHSNVQTVSDLRKGSFSVDTPPQKKLFITLHRLDIRF